VKIGDRHTTTEAERWIAKNESLIVTAMCRRKRWQETFDNFEHNPEWAEGPLGMEKNVRAVLAFCSMTGRIFIGTSHNEECEPETFMLNGIEVGVRYIGNPRHNLIVIKKKRSFCDAYVLMLEVPDGTFRYMGWATMDEIREQNMGCFRTWIMFKKFLHDGEPRCTEELS